MKTVGITHSGYGTLKNISSLPFKKFRVEKKYDIFKIPEHFIFKLTNKINPLLLNLHQDFGFSKCDIFHFFNAVSFSKTPWVTTFETSVPRFGQVSAKYNTMGVKLLAGKHCKRLIAMSECTREIELDFLRNNHFDYYEAIKKKIVVLYPAQKALIDNYARKELSPDLSFIIVGAEFFRKGGREIVYTFDKLIEEGRNINLHIVSSMESKGYATDSEYKATMELIRKHPKHIFKYEYLTNEEVMALFLKCHIGLMPTYADTFGYSVLEAQSAGCPVITTNVRALPEINNNELGWIIPVPKNELGHAEVNTQAKREKFSMVLQNGLEAVMRGIISDTSQISSKGVKCIERIKEKHDPGKLAAQLEDIYNNALADRS